MVADRALHAVARAVDDVIADPHGRRAAAVEIHCGANAELVGHELRELGERQPRNAGAPPIGDDEVQQRAVIGDAERGAWMRRARKGVAAGDRFGTEGLAVVDDHGPAGDRRVDAARRRVVEVGALAEDAALIGNLQHDLAFHVLHVRPRAAGADGEADGIEFVVEIVAVDRGDGVHFLCVIRNFRALGGFGRDDDADLIAGHVDVVIAFAILLVVDARRDAAPIGACGGRNEDDEDEELSDGHVRRQFQALCHVRGTLDAVAAQRTPMSQEPEFLPTRYSKWNPDGSGRHTSKPDLEKTPPKATRSQSAVEIVLFAVFAVLIVLAAVALYTSYYSTKYRTVPNTVDAGLKNDRVNIVLFGIGGDGHPQHDQLADSIMFVSLKPSTKQAAIISIPRDLWIRIGQYGTHRINYTHEVGNQSGYPGKGPGLLCDTVSQVLGQPVNAYVRVDFSAFEKLINDVGGVDVYWILYRL